MEPKWSKNVQRTRKEHAVTLANAVYYAGGFICLGLTFLSLAVIWAARELVRSLE